MRNRIVAFLVLALVATGCATTRNTGGVERQETSVLVENRGFSDMTIYVLRSSQRVRLGTANGNRTSRFTVPPDMVLGMGLLTFVADPIGSTRTSTSEQVMVSPGDEVVLTIPPG